MSNFTIILPDGDPALERALHAPSLIDTWNQLGGLKVLTGGPLAGADAYVEAIGDAEAVIVGWPLPSGVLTRCPRLRFATFLGTGATNYIDLAEAASQGVTVSNAPGYGDVAVAEHTLALMLSGLRQVPRLDEALRNGDWLTGIGGTEIYGKTVGLVGFGGIGAHVARLLRAFGARVVAWTRNPSSQRATEHGVEFLELDELLATSDVVSLHLNLNAHTRGIISAERVAKLREDTLIVNTARAELVDEEAMRSRLLAGKFYAALDVFTPEPLPQGHSYEDVPNVVLTPHIGYDTPEAIQRMMSITAENCRTFFEGSPINLVSEP